MRITVVESAESISPNHLANATNATSRKSGDGASDDDALAPREGDICKLVGKNSSVNLLENIPR